MKMSLVVEGLRADVVAVGELGDERVAEVADRIAGLVARSAPIRVLDLLSDAAAELSAELPEGRVEIRLVGDDIEFAYIDDRPAWHDGEAELSSRITLRLPERLKARVEDSASSQGISVNAWMLRTLERATTSAGGTGARSGRRLHGYGTT
jgi:hypothetical protein